MTEEKTVYQSNVTYTSFQSNSNQKIVSFLAEGNYYNITLFILNLQCGTLKFINYYLKYLKGVIFFLSF